MKPRTGKVIAFLSALLLLAGCVQPAPNTRPWLLGEGTPPSETLAPSLENLMPTARSEGAPYFTPTPDAPHPLPTLRADNLTYTIKAGDTMAWIANRFNLPFSVVAGANPEITPSALEVGQTLTLPAPQAEPPYSHFKIIPDSELVYGPASATLDVEAFVAQQAGTLNAYSEELEDQRLSGAQIVRRVSYEYSVNPRLLLALLEYESGWVTRNNIDPSLKEYPMGRYEVERKGLYKQLAWTADQLNRAFYLYEINALPYVILADNRMVMLSKVINPGTAAVQYFAGLLHHHSGYMQAISEGGVYATYVSFFGIPFDLTVEDLQPADLTQPDLLLPFESGVTWSFTSGPHGGWGNGSAWAALDFSPSGDASGCFRSEAWVTASADGLVTRAKDGAVVLDLDGDGLEQTGWTLHYAHIATRDRVTAGTYVKAGERIGHPSCEGGVSTGTHFHIARRYNGVWIAADRDLPMNLEGWISAGKGVQYNGTLTRDGQTLIAWSGRIDENQITR